MAATDDDLAEAREAAREASYAGLRAALGGQPDVAPGPDVDAGGAGLDGDAIRARAEFVESGWDNGVLLDDAPDGWAEAVDELTQRDVPALLAALAKTVQQRDEARAGLADMGRIHAEAERTLDETRAELAEAHCGPVTDDGSGHA
jgi:hypothetical protein